ncbi:cytochrome P450 6j1 [Tribolium castaneum]|uniref:Cytochrome P450 345C1 n=1 Tax=Tribolium castaneum TaxID=7070 RepID=D7EJS8_TRICA|nr:PREDICTED: cytochrome P450 6j1 [Tribolium castaneum]EFA12854.2 cytochrome P450 345C1 [Tribolium castaneum]|eukprot:XP_015835338.1 PREDICTED: cytochrome P450 6j1 [Tribolium castaneum]
MMFVIFFAVLFLIYYYLTRNFKHWEKKNVPFIKPLPFFGSIYDGVLMRHSIGEVFYDLYYKSTKPFVGFFILDKPCLLIRDPKLIKKILVNDFQYFYDRNAVNNKRDDPISTHILFILKNPDWRELRTKMTPVFTSSKIKIMSELIENASHEMTNYLNNHIKDYNSVEMRDVCLKFTVDVIGSTIFGVQANSFKDENSQFSSVAKRLIDWDDIVTAFRFRCYLLAPLFVNLFRMKLFPPDCVNFLKNTFLDIMDKRSVSNKSRNDLIDILLQMKNDNRNFIEGDILVSQALMFFVAGFETTSSTMGFALYEFARNPDIQDKIRNEIKDISDKYGDIKYDSLKEMEYLDMCVKEVLRKYPVVPFLDRKCNTTYTIPDTNVTIDKDTPIFIPSLALHYDPQYFPNADIFDPERFSSNNKTGIDSFAYLPFGEGPRNCIGARFGLLTAKLGLVHILKEFVVSCNEKSNEKIKFNPKGMVLSALNGINLKLSKVEKAT